VGRRFVVALIALGCALVASGPAHGFTRSDHSLTMGDGVALAVTLYTPSGEPPAGGWPAVLMLHGLGGSRADMNAIAEAYLAPQGYAVATVDARGHGASGGQCSLVGARELADYAAVLGWLRARPGVSDDRVGAYGVSLGGGSVWRLLTAPGTRLAAAVPVTTWTSLYDSLFPQGLAKSGLVAYFLNLLPPERWHPDVLALRDDALQSRNLPRLREFANARSVRHALGAIRTPVFMIHGRRDFAFDVDEALRAFSRLRAPKRLYLGDLGHAPAPNPPAERAYYLTHMRMWFDRFLKGQLNGIDTRPQLEFAPDPWTARSYQGRRPPARRVLRLRFRGSRTIDGLGKVVRTVAPTRRLNETFGAGVVSVRLSTRTGWPHVVAVLSATTPRGQEIVISEGGAPTPTLGGAPRLVTIRLLSQATVIPRGSRLRLTLAGSSTAQHPENAVYYAGVPSASRLSIGESRVLLPVLRRPVSR
jgi:predicted acyl esterase